MSLAGQQLVRCPHCISVQPRGPGGELLLDPGRNVCASRNCGRTFMAHQAILEDYPRDGRRLPPANAHSAPSRPANLPQPKNKGGVQPALFGGTN